MPQPAMEVTPPETPVRGRALQPEPTPSPSDFRDPSISGFSDEGPAASLRLELDRLISHSPPQARPHFAAQMNAFYDLFVRWQRTKGDKLDWNRVRGLTPDDPSMARYDSLKQVEPDRVTSLLSKLAIIKLNGGLGTTMGLKGPKSAIEVRQGLSFLDLCVLQVRYLNRKYDVNVPLVLMNSFNTHEMTEKLIKKYDGDDVDVRMFEQSVAPRISRESLLPVPHKPEITEHTKQNWYPPGHGDIWVSLERSGILDELLEAGKQWLFVSNVDNLGASADLAILQHLDESQTEFLVELTPKTKADVKGGTLIEYNGRVRLLEVAQVPSQYRNEFYSIRKFSTFNTNNLWVNIKALKKLFDRYPNGPELDIIENPKTTDAGEAVIQLETAMASAVQSFTRSGGLLVPRSRFVPVKSTSDLLLAQSEGLYSLKHGQLVVNPARPFGGVPVIKLGNEFARVSDYDKRFESPPNITDLDHLTVSGNVWFRGPVVLAGTVIIVATHGQQIDIPSGSVLENKIVTGNMRILDH